MSKLDPLVDLHNALAAAFTDALKSGEFTASMAAQAREFLSDNKITVQAGTPAARHLEVLSDTLTDDDLPFDATGAPAGRSFDATGAPAGRPRMVTV